MSSNFIDHWSYSSLSLFLRNRLAFKKKYILKNYDSPKSPSSVVGTAGHKTLEALYKGSDIDAAISIGLKHLDTVPDFEINFGKTGSREKLIKDFTQGINFYLEERPDYKETIGVELSITESIKDRNGRPLPILAKAKADLVVRNDEGQIVIIDHKFVSSYSDGALDIPKYIIQSMFLFHTVEAMFGESPESVIFNECKISKNKDGSDQIQPYILKFDQPANFALFYSIYNDCCREISNPDITFLPNFDDMFDGQDSFESYRAGIIDVTAPIAVNHKTKEVEFADRQYIPSKAETIENRDITPEEKIRLKLQEFGVTVEMQETHVGATITQYTLKPSRGVRMSKFDASSKDLALTLQAQSIRIEAPIRGTNLVGIEVPSSVRTRVDLSPGHFVNGTLNIPVGIDVFGKVLYKDLTEMPHLLIAGATGAGKSVMINTIITALTEQLPATELQLILVDPKRVELSAFKNLPHLLCSVIYNDDEAAKALDWLCEEMEARYKILEEASCRSVDEYNMGHAKMSKIVVVIDEFADLILQGKDKKANTEMSIFGSIEKESLSSEKAIIRLAQKARAIGIHLIIATQRPSADVVTGLIKANIPTKICFMTTSRVNSQIVLDQPGAEELTGKGDMLFLDPTRSGLMRLQGLYS